MRAAAAILAAVVALVALALTLPGANTTGRAAPALPGHALRGQPITLASLRGHPALVSFFASWCGPCAREAPDMQRAYAALAGRAGLVAVDWSDDRSSALAFVRRYRWTFPVLEDSKGLVGNDYGIAGLPTTFVLDASGHIVKRLTGPQTAAALLAAVHA